MFYWLPEGVSTYAKDIDFVFFVIYYVTAFIFILVTVLMVYFLKVYRYKEGEERRALYTHGNTKLELIWTIIPAIVFLSIFFVSKSTWAKIKASTPPPDIQVRLQAKQFGWKFTYPGPDGKFDTADDKSLEGDLHVPVNKVVRLVMRSDDVIHSLFIPSFRLKQDIVPGREIIAWFNATKAGKYEVPCAELCGPGHSGMRGWVTVYPEAEYQAWVKKLWPSS